MDKEINPSVPSAKKLGENDVQTVYPAESGHTTSCEEPEGCCTRWDSCKIDKDLQRVTKCKHHDRDRRKEKRGKDRRFRERGLKTRKNLSVEIRQELAMRTRIKTGTNNPKQQARRNKLLDALVVDGESQLVKAGVETNPGPHSRGSRSSSCSSSSSSGRQKKRSHKAKRAAALEAKWAARTVSVSTLAQEDCEAYECAQPVCQGRVQTILIDQPHTTESSSCVNSKVESDNVCQEVCTSTDPLEVGAPAEVPSVRVSRGESLLLLGKILTPAEVSAGIRRRFPNALPLECFTQFWQFYASRQRPIDQKCDGKASPLIDCRRVSDRKSEMLPTSMALCSVLVTHITPVRWWEVMAAKAYPYICATEFHPVSGVMNIVRRLCGVVRFVCEKCTMNSTITYVPSQLSDALCQVSINSPPDMMAANARSYLLRQPSLPIPADVVADAIDGSELMLPVCSRGVSLNTSWPDQDEFSPAPSSGDVSRGYQRECTGWTRKSTLLDTTRGMWVYRTLDQGFFVVESLLAYACAVMVCHSAVLIIGGLISGQFPDTHLLAFAGTTQKLFVAGLRKDYSGILRNLTKMSCLSSGILLKVGSALISLRCLRTSCSHLKSGWDKLTTLIIESGSCGALRRRMPIPFLL